MIKIKWNPISPATQKQEFFKKQKASILERSLMQTGIPTIENASSPKEDALGLLKLASEVEHALMVQYLYSSISVKGSFARVVSNVAIQEMGHLLTVQNLSLAISGVSAEGIPNEIHLGKDELRNKSDLNPLPFVLEKVSKLALCKFVVVERPEKVSDEQIQLKLERIQNELIEQDISFNPVYSLYAAIKWLFQKNDNPENPTDLSSSLGFKPGWHLSDTDFVSSSEVNNYSSDVSEWGAFPGLIVHPVLSRSDALKAIDLITEQGEGILDHDDSHFEKFLQLLELFENRNIRVKNLPRTPYIGEMRPQEDRFAIKIEYPYTANWAELFNIQYELLIIDIACAISVSRESQCRQQLIDLTLNFMNNILGPMSVDMTRRKLLIESPLIAGPTYQLLDQSIPKTKRAFKERYNRLLSSQSNTIAAIKDSDEYDLDRAGQLRMDKIGQITENRANILNQLNLD